MTEPLARAARPRGMRTTLVLAAPLLPLLVACSGTTTAEDTESATTGAVTLDDLEGSWVATADGPAGVTLVFAHGRLRATAGCNSLSARSDVVDRHLVVRRLLSTEIGCSPEVADTEEWLARLLQDDPSVSLDGDTLTLSASDDTLLLEPGTGMMGTPTGDASGGVVGHKS